MVAAFVAFMAFAQKPAFSTIQERIGASVRPGMSIIGCIARPMASFRPPSAKK
jgi:hypothetical protein